MAIASYGNRFVQVYMKRERRLYLFEFWQNGLCLAEGYISHLVPVAQTIDLWLSSECSPDDLVDQFPFIAPYDNSTFKEAAKQVEKRWDFYCSDGEFPELQTFFHLAAQDEVLSQLCPYTSLYTLRFSRCAEFPFDSEGMPDVTPKAYENYAFSLEKSKAQAITLPPDEGEIFVVIINRTQYVGEGNATTALQLVKSLLPPGIKPIRKHGQQ
ncbi:hypothetical protein GCM10011379_34220 [Filimonas zeae]|uniref:Uncharacterized protein n=2 Tax=Filimonas zeae TaxID=1737353 RepID=A0A917J049_9BACT|nr:hypothetical protein GCM10011379_34220 [Filimonas zeae]